MNRLQGARAAPCVDAGPRNPARILLIIPTLAGGGSERVFVTLARLLDRRRFRVGMAVFDLAEERFRNEIPADVDFTVLGSRKVRFGLAAAVRLIRREAPDIVVSTLNHLNTSIALTRGLWPRCVRFVARPSIAPSVDVAMHSYPALWRKLVRAAARRTDMFIVQSREMEADLLGVVCDRPTPTRALANPLDVARLRELAGARRMRNGRGDRCRIVAAGRLDEQKGFDLLLDAVAIVVKTTRLSLTILGEGPSRGALEGQIERLGLRKSVSLPGYSANPYQVFAQSDLFVLSSRYEGFPNVVIEALACGTPVVATPLPGLASLLETIPGCRIASAISAPALADAIAAALAEPPQEICADAIAPFGNGAVAAYEDAFLDVLHGRLRATRKSSPSG